MAKKFIALLCVLGLQTSCIFASAEEHTEKLSEISLTPTQKTVCDIAESTYRKINEKWLYPAKDKPLSTDSSYWSAGHDKIGDNGSSIPNLQFKGNIGLICEAFDDLIACPAVLECTTSSTVVQIMCLKALLGQDQFEKYTKSIWQACQNAKRADLFFFTLPKQFWMISTQTQIAPGTFWTIKNIPEYVTYKPGGLAQSENVVCLGDDRHVGFGTIYQNGPLSIEAIEESLRLDFISVERVRSQYTTAHAQKVQQYENIDAFKEACGNLLAKQVIQFDPEKIQKFLKTGQYR